VARSICWRAPGILQRISAASAAKLLEVCSKYLVMLQEMEQMEA
jgi:hypothetical protein